MLRSHSSSYNLVRMPNQNRRKSTVLVIAVVTVFLLILSIISLVLASIALHKVIKDSNNVETNPSTTTVASTTSTLPPSQTYIGQLLDKDRTWESAYLDPNSTVRQKAEDDYTKLISESKFSKTPEAFDVDTKIGNFSESYKLKEFMIQAYESRIGNIGYVMAEFVLQLTSRVAGIETPTAAVAQQYIDSFAKESNMNITAENVHRILTSVTPGFETGVEGSTTTPGTPASTVTTASTSTLTTITTTTKATPKTTTTSTTKTTTTTTTTKPTTKQPSTTSIGTTLPSTRSSEATVSMFTTEVTNATSLTTEFTTANTTTVQTGTTTTPITTTAFTDTTAIETSTESQTTPATTSSISTTGSSSQVPSTSTTAATKTTPTTAIPSTTPRLPDDWYAAAAYLNSSMNTSVDPCDDFYQYTCGNWIKSHPIPEGQANFLVFSEVQLKVYNDSLKGINSITRHNISALTQTKRAFDKCMGSQDRMMNLKTVISQINIRTITLPILDKNWNGTGFVSSIPKLWGFLTADHGINSFFQTFTNVDVGGDNISQSALFVNQGDLILGSRDLYINESLAANASIAFQKMIVNLTKTMAQVEKRNLTEEPEIFAQKMFNLEKSLAMIMLPSSAARNHSVQYNRYSLGDLSNATDGFPWDEFLMALLPESTHWVIEEDHYVIVQQPSYLNGITKQIANYTKTDFVNYMALRCILQYSSLLPVMESALPLKRGNPQRISGTEEGCVDALTMLLPWTTGRVYVEAAGFSSEDRKNVNMLVGTLIEALNDTMKDVDFLDENSRKNAERKVSNIIRNPGYPIWILNDMDLEAFHSDLNIQTLVHWADVYQKLLAWTNVVQFKMLNQYVDRTNFLGSPAYVNAWYEPELNSITFPAAILRAPFYRPNGPPSLNYGAIGSVIGHELTHGFDDEGVQYDWYGRLNLWMDEHSRSGFRAFADCIVNEYDKFCYPEIKMCLDGVTNQGENIADNGGIRQSFKALKQWEAEHGPERHLPGFEDFTTEQLFYLGFASFWCGSETLAYDRQLILTNPHSPPKFRVLGTLRNLDEFATAFKCPASSAMSQPDSDRCYVWANDPGNETTASVQTKQLFSKTVSL